MTHHRRHPAAGAYPPANINFAGHEHLEEQNNQQEDKLRDNVELLKSLAIDIGNEITEHNRLLPEADKAFDSTGGLLGNTIGKVRRLAKSGYRYYFLYIFLFCLFVFLVLWFVI